MRVGGEKVEMGLMDYCLAVWEQGTRRGRREIQTEKEAMKTERKETGYLKQVLKSESETQGRGKCKQEGTVSFRQKRKQSP